MKFASVKTMNKMCTYFMVYLSFFVGISDVRVTGDSGATLPNPRNVSRVLNNHFIHSPAIFSYFMMQFGQFLDHDITHTDLTEVENDDGKLQL